MSPQGVRAAQRVRFGKRHLNTVEPVRQKCLNTGTTLSPENLSFLTCFCFSLLQPFEAHCISPFSYKQSVNSKHKILRERTVLLRISD